MKLEELFKKEYRFNDADLCDTFPQLVFRSEVGKKEKFTVTLEPNNQGISFKGTIRDPVEVNELIDFLKFVNHSDATPLNEKNQGTGTCPCGADDWKLISRADRFDGPLCGELFLILKCNVCEKSIKLNVGNR